MKLTILGVDPGTRYAGFSVLQKEKKKTILIDYGCLKMPASRNLIHRVGTFHDFFSDKIQQWNITNLGIETPFIGKNPTTFGKLSYLRSILYLLSYKHELQLHEFTPRGVKMDVTGFGGASKEQVANMVLKFFPGIKTPLKDDVTDSLGVSLCTLWKNKDQNKKNIKKITRKKL